MEGEVTHGGQQVQKRGCRRGGETRRRRVLHQPTERLVSTGVGVPEVRQVPRSVRRLPGVDRPDGRRTVGQVHRRGGVRRPVRRRRARAGFGSRGEDDAGDAPQPERVPRRQQEGAQAADGHVRW